MLAPPKTVPTNDEKALVIKVEGDKDVNELSNGTASNVNDTDSLHVSLLRSCQPTKLQKVWKISPGLNEIEFLYDIVAHTCCSIFPLFRFLFLSNR